MKKYETRLYNGNISKSEKRSKFAKVLAIGACATSFGIGYSAGYSASTEILNETEKIIEQRQRIDSALSTVGNNLFQCSQILIIYFFH